MAPSSNSNIEARISLQRSRFQLIQHATEFDNDDDIFPTTRQFINTRLEMLEQNWSKFQEGHEELCHSGVEVLNHQYMKSRVYERCQEFYIHARAKLLTQRDEIEALLPTSESSSTDACAPVAVSRRLSALPKIALPRFSGNFQDWRSFHDLFTSLIRNNSELSDVERMHYLKTSLSGDAARFVTNLPVSGDGFAIAWETLVSRYDNKRFLISAHLDRLTSLKPLKNKSAQDLSSFLATVSESLGALRSLGCLVDCWDPLLLHMLIKLLDSESREAWEVKLGSSTSYPSFSQFEDFLIGQSRALQNLSLHTSSTASKERPKRATEATQSRSFFHVATSSITSDTLTCPLCTSTYYLATCPSYHTKTLNQRRDIIVKFKRCYNCLGLHTASQCRSTKRCRKCGKKHHTSLHVPQEKTTLNSNIVATVDKATLDASNKKQVASD